MGCDILVCASILHIIILILRQGTIKSQKKRWNNNNNSSENVPSPTNQPIDLDSLKNINIKKRSQSGSNEREAKERSDKRIKKSADSEPTTRSALDEDKLSKLNEYEDNAKMRLGKEKQNRAELARKSSSAKLESNNSSNPDEPSESKEVSAPEKRNELPTATQGTRPSQHDAELNRVAAEYKHKGEKWKTLASSETDKSLKKYDFKDNNFLTP
jgi:hypothetical protein